MSNPPAEIQSLLAKAKRLYTVDEVENALASLADQINADLSEENLVLLPVMNGGLTLAAALLRKLNFPLQVDYMHITRYRNSTSGGELDWIYKPRLDISDRNVLIIDDLLDHGITLEAAVDYCRGRGAASVKTAVLIVKNLTQRPGLQRVDYFALEAPDEYLFGYGMDYKSYWRNAPGIFFI